MANETRRFGATLSKPMKIATYLVGYGLAMGVPVAVGVNIYLTSHDPRAFGIALVPGAILLVASLFRPRGYSVSADEVRVERPIGPVRVPLERIESVKDGAPFLAGRPIGIFRVGGFYGSYGRFRSSTLGVFDLYFTGELPVVAIRRRGAKPLLISPDDCGPFLDALARAARERGLSFPIERPALASAAATGD